MDPARELFRTHRFVEGDTIDVGTVFPSPRGLQPITFSFDFAVTGASPNGLFFELGTTARGCAAWYDNASGEFGVCAGAGTASADNGVSATRALDITLNRIYRVSFATSPGDGTIRAWLDGELVLAAQSVNSGFGGDWTGAFGGKVGGPNSTVTDRVPAGARVSLVDLALVSPFAVYANQRPRQYYTGRLG